MVFALLLRGTDQEHWDLALEMTIISHMLVYDQRMLYFIPDEGHMGRWLITM